MATMREQHRGQCIYVAEPDVHFPHLTVLQTLNLAARISQPSGSETPSERESAARRLVEDAVKSTGLENTLGIKVGNAYIKGISGEERKRISIAEVLLRGTPLQCWDNSIRGLDSATALQVVREEHHLLF